MDYVKMIEQARKEMLQEVNQRCDELIQQYQNGEQGTQPKTMIRECRLGWVSPTALKGKRPLSITFTSGETVVTPTWKKAVQAILKHCNEQPDMHERLMELRGKVFGRQRTILGRSPEGMDVPLQIDEGLYFESKFDTEALITMMEKKVLRPVGYDFSGIIIQYMGKGPTLSESLTIMQSEMGEEIPEEVPGGGMELS